ncbi:hypothetical protein B488_01510 [Liberibacter crescens BT-1]|uniref:GcrA cell cycle regulator n=1 Tax=Liberibacter crescens (strain BT-1) TaxID=1215343 RepID=L0ERM8_LIBCB|nr:GcrA family cell cycle regulator [Liberibacter crescens]AGA64144.1 hypothetical protein B488_01510 [Liberibacter crescens BT-1]AMC12413.1 hypothetical protein RL73_00935 [Liberibacter crescens]
MSWTEERVDKLKKFWSEGLSASQIAMQLGGVSRNAVIGKVHRLALLGRNKAPADHGIRSLDDTQEQSADSLSAHSEDSLQKTDSKTVKEEVKEIESSEISLLDKGMVTSCKLKLTELTESTCKWPFGDPLKDDFYFCGCRVEASSVYCEYHTRIAYQQIPERRKSQVKSS